MRISDDFGNRGLIASVMGCTTAQADFRALAIVANLIEQLKSGGTFGMDQEPCEMGELGELLKMLPKQDKRN